MAKILVSACLLGCRCRYDAKLKTCEAVLKLADDNILIPVCPEQMGGLATPRNPSERVGSKVLMNSGEDVTENYMTGAENVLRIAQINNIDYAILKSGSPSCGSKFIYDGSFTGKKIPGSGVTAELLKNNGFKVISEEDLQVKDL